MRSRTSIWCGLLALSACGADPSDVPSTARAARGVIDGHPSAGRHPAVGAMLERARFTTSDPRYSSIVGDYPYAFACSGTLIAPDVFLTAAHCLELTDSFCSEHCYRADYYGQRVAFVDDVRSLEGGEVAPANTYGFTKILQYWNYSPEAIHEDLGLLFLDRAVPDIEPVPVATPDDLVDVTNGTPVTIVGYGQTSSAARAAGVRYEATTTVLELTRGEIKIGGRPPIPRTCYGDSGGPALLDVDGVEKIIGITSHGYANQSEQCARDTVDMRVDLYDPWIERELAKACAEGKRPAGMCPATANAGGCTASHGTSAGAGDALVVVLSGLALLNSRRRSTRRR